MNIFKIIGRIPCEFVISKNGFYLVVNEFHWAFSNNIYIYIYIFFFAGLSTKFFNINKKLQLEDSN